MCSRRRNQCFWFIWQLLNRNWCNKLEIVLFKCKILAVCTYFQIEFIAFTVLHMVGGSRATSLIGWNYPTLLITPTAATSSIRKIGT